MSFRALRAALVAATLLAFAAALLAVLAAPQVGAAYSRLVGPLGKDLPLLTVKLSLPVLRTAPGGPHQEPTTTIVAVAAWLPLLVGPWAILISVLRARDVPDAVARWVMAWSIVLPLVAALGAFVLLGLALPFGCL